MCYFFSRSFPFASIPFHGIFQLEFGLQNLCSFFFLLLPKSWLHLGSLHHSYTGVTHVKLIPVYNSRKPVLKPVKLGKSGFPQLQVLQCMLEYVQLFYTSLILLSGFAIWVKDRHAYKNCILAGGCQTQWATAEFFPSHSPQESLSPLCMLLIFAKLSGI